MEKLVDLDKYLERRDNTLVFIGEKLVCKIPSRFEDLGLLQVGEQVKTVGIFGIEVDDKYTGAMLLLGFINIEPSSIEKEVIDEQEYQILTLTTGDVFISNTIILQSTGLVYTLFNEFISYGKLPYFVDYELAAKLFDDTDVHTGMSLDFSHSIFEILIAHLYRDSEDYTIPYRLTDMKRPGTFVKMKSVQDAPMSTGAKLLGSYFRDALVSSLVVESKDQHDIENLLRY